MFLLELFFRMFGAKMNVLVEGHADLASNYRQDYSKVEAYSCCLSQQDRGCLHGLREHLSK